VLLNLTSGQKIKIFAPIDAEPRGRARHSGQRAKRKFLGKFQVPAASSFRRGLSGHNTVDPGRLSHSSPDNMLWVLWVLWGRPHNTHNML